MKGIDFSSWQTILLTLVGLSIATLIGISIRLVIMQIIQQKRERENRQINERLRTLIAAYKVLGGSFTGNLDVDPTHLHDIKQKLEQKYSNHEDDFIVDESNNIDNNERKRRIRDAVESALSDIILLGTDEQVRLAAQAATELTKGYPVNIEKLVISLRNFIRQTLDLDPILDDLFIPRQGPTRPSGTKGKQGNNETNNKNKNNSAMLGEGTGTNAETRVASDNN